MLNEADDMSHNRYIRFDRRWLFWIKGRSEQVRNGECNESDGNYNDCHYDSAIHVTDEGIAGPDSVSKTSVQFRHYRADSELLDSEINGTRKQKWSLLTDETAIVIALQLTMEVSATKALVLSE